MKLSTVLSLCLASTASAHFLRHMEGKFPKGLPRNLKTITRGLQTVVVLTDDQTCEALEELVGVRAEVYNGDCIVCQEQSDSDADDWCEGENSNAEGQPGLNCYLHVFTEDCRCKEGFFIEADDECVRDCQLGVGTAWCRSQDQNRLAYAKADIRSIELCEENPQREECKNLVTCFDNFREDCLCPTGYTMQDNGCFGAVPRTANTLAYLGNPPNVLTDGGKLAKCQGDCDTDDDCSGSMVCHCRSPLTEVPGCADVGENEDSYEATNGLVGTIYDFCVDVDDLPDDYDGEGCTS